MIVKKKDLETLLKHMESDSSLYKNTAVEALKDLYAQTGTRTSLELEDSEQHILQINIDREDIKKALEIRGFKGIDTNIGKVYEELDWPNMKNDLMHEIHMHLYAAIEDIDPDLDY